MAAAAMEEEEARASAAMAVAGCWCSRAPVVRRGIGCGSPASRRGGRSHYYSSSGEYMSAQASRQRWRSSRGWVGATSRA